MDLEQSKQKFKTPRFVGQKGLTAKEAPCGLFFKIHTEIGKKAEGFTHKAREEEGTLNSFAMHEGEYLEAVVPFRRISQQSRDI